MKFFYLIVNFVIQFFFNGIFWNNSIRC